MYYVYVLENPDNKGWYIGYTGDLRRRLVEHNSGKGGQTTRRGINWKLMYYEAYVNKRDAMGRERFLKSSFGRKYLKKQLAHYLNK